MSTQEAVEHTAESLRKELGGYRPEFLVPGVWSTLETNCTQWAADISVGFYWAEVNKNLTQWRTEYKASTNANLLAEFDLPKFSAKPINSIIDKLLRQSKKKGTLEDLIPGQGPPIPIIGDIIRTRIKCPYIDGVEFLTTKLHDLSVKLRLEPVRERQGKIQGYYAQHINILHEVNYREGGHGQLTKIKCEIQIASSMASQMWEASHPLYEAVRSDVSSPESWQWKPDDPQFISNQLGHMIHLADGLLVQLRDSKKSRKA